MHANHEPESFGQVDRPQGTQRQQGRLSPRDGPLSEDNRPQDGVTVAFQREPFSAIIREALPLTRRHWKEVALWQDKAPLDPDLEYYFQAERQGRLEFLTARDKGVLVGYIGMIISTGLHYRSTIWAMSPVFWLDPAYREGRTGLKLFLEMEKILRAREVQVFELQPMRHFEEDRGGVGKVLKHLGFEHTSNIFQKWIGD